MILSYTTKQTNQTSAVRSESRNPVESEKTRDSSLENKRVLLVLPFQNLANSSKHNFIADSMFDFFISGLSGY